MKRTPVHYQILNRNYIATFCGTGGSDPLVVKNWEKVTCIRCLHKREMCYRDNDYSAALRVMNDYLKGQEPTIPFHNFMAHCERKIEELRCAASAV